MDIKPTVETSKLDIYEDLCYDIPVNTQIYRVDYEGNISENIETEGVFYDCDCPLDPCDD